MRELKLSDISLYCIFRDLLKNLWIIILCAAMAVMGTEVVFSDLFVPDYASTATFYVGAKDSTKSAYYDLGTSSATALVLCDVFESNIMSRKAAESLGLEYLDADIIAAVTPNTNLLSLTAIAYSPSFAFTAVRAVINNHDKVSSHVFDNVVIEILDHPSMPAAPYNLIELRPAQMKAAGIGAVLAILMIIALSVLRSTVKTEEALKRYLDTGVFVVLRYVKKFKFWKAVPKKARRAKALLVTDPLVGFEYTETIEKICARLEYVKDSRGHKIYLVTSARENEGKSTAAINIALTLARRGHKVLLVDADLRKPAQFKMLDKQSVPHMDFSKVLIGKASPEQAVRFDEKTRLYLLLNKEEHKNSADLISSPGMKGLLAYCRGMMDYIIVDSPPVSTMSDTEALLGLCDASLLVVRQDYTSIRILNDVIVKLRSKDLLGCVFNAVRGFSLARKAESKRYESYYSNM